MSNELDLALQLCREPMLVLCNDIIVNANAAAKELFGNTLLEHSIYEFISEYVLSTSPAPSFTSCVETPLGLRTLTVSSAGDTQILHFSGDESGDKPGYLSDVMLSTLLSSLFNTGLAIGKVGSDDGLSDQSKNYLSIINHNYYAMLRLIGNLHCAVQLSEDSLNLNRATIDLGSICEKTTQSLSSMLSERVFIYNAPAYPVYISADEEKIERVLLNIIANSYQHTDKGGKITLSLEKRDNRALITIRDNGCGIKPEILREVFTRYNVRLSEANLSSGLRPGLGLAISRGIVSCHNGTLVVDSTENEGTAIYISLPLSDCSGITLGDYSPLRTVSDMHLLLTEFSDIFDSSFYTGEYLD